MSDRGGADPRVSRRDFLRSAAVVAGGGALAAACGSGGAAGPGRSPRATGAPSSVAARTAGTAQVSLIGTGADAAPTNPGTNRLGFELITLAGAALGGGSPEVWVATSTTAPAKGPYRAEWHDFTGYAKTGDRSPKTALPGVYSAEVDYPGPGTVNIGVTLTAGGRRYGGQGAVLTTASHVVAGLGTRALATPTPVATTEHGIEEICTRKPVDHLHTVSLADAVRSGKPTVVAFATPLLCSSQLCGPVVDEVILVAEAVGTKRANFIHVEEFLPGPDLKPPPPTPANLSPAFKAWGFESEPWVVVIDKDGVIRFRSLGPVTAPEIDAALVPLL